MKNFSKMRELSLEIAEKLLPILKEQNFALRLYFYNHLNKSIYIENDLVDKMVYIKHVNIEYNMPYMCQSNIDNLTLNMLTEMIAEMYLVRDFIKTNEIAEKVKQLQERIKEINELIN